MSVLEDDLHECDFRDTCSVCRGPGPKTRATVSRTFVAAYDDHCARGCNLAIRAGELIYKDIDGSYAHVDCFDSAVR